jgi:phage-related protein (TIGR01555 family)
MTFSDNVNKVLRALRLDSWQSTLGGLGSRSDRGRVGSVSFCDQPTLTDYELSAAYRNLWLVRRLVEAKPGDALREGFGVEEDRIPEFTRLNYATHTEGALERALMLAQLKGGAGVFVGYRGDSAESILEPAPEGQGEVAFLETFDKFQLTAQARNDDILSPDYDKPEVWCVTGTRRAGMRFHTSRLIKFYGAPLPSSTLQGTAAEDRDWGDSVLQAVWADVQRYGVFWQSVAHLMQLSSVGVLKIAGLIEMLASQNQDVARDRVDLLNESMSITRLMLLDAKHEESYTREAVSFADMPALLQEIQTATAGAFKMPVTKLFGRSPAGMNATGESDTRMWYDEVEGYRERSVKPGLSQLLSITDGVTEELEFPSLWQESDAEKANTRKVTIDANERLWTMRVVSEAEIRKAMYEGKDIEELMTGEPPEDAGPEPAPAPRSPFGLGSPALAEPEPADAADAI